MTFEMLLLALLTAPSPVAPHCLPQVPPPTAPSAPKADETRESLYYKAFHAEVALRDFEQAEVLYASAVTTHDDTWTLDLQVKCLLGQGRCLALQGKKDAAKSCFENALKIADPPIPQLAKEAKEALAKLAEPSKTSERIVARIEELLGEMAGDTATSALGDFARMGDVAVPTLATALRDEDVTLVSRAARALAHIETHASYEAIASAFGSAELLYPRAVIEALVGHANQTVGAIRRETVPAFLAVLSLKEVELRKGFVTQLEADLYASDTDAVTAYVTKLLEDPEPSIRSKAFGVMLPRETLIALVPKLSRMLGSDEVGERRLAAVCISSNLERLPPDVLDATIGRVQHDPDPEIRGKALSAEVNRAQARDPALAASFVVRMLADDSPLVFARAVDHFADNRALREAITETAHEGVAKAWRRAFEDPALSDETRHRVFDKLDADRMTDDELIDLFVRGGQPQCVARPDVVRSARRDLLKPLSERHARGRSIDFVQFFQFAASLLRRTTDRDGKLECCARFYGSNVNFAELPLLLAAMNDDDLVVRREGYEKVGNTGHRVGSKQLTHLADDLAQADDSFASQLLAIVGGEPNPALVPGLKALLARSSGNLHAAAITAYASAAGRDAQPELLAALRATPKYGEFRCLPWLAEIAGVEIAEELVAAAKRHGGAQTVLDWMIPSNQQRQVAPQLVESFVRKVPHDLLSGDDLKKVASSIPVDLLSEFVLEALRSGDYGKRLAAVEIAGWSNVDAAWEELLKVLDSGDGELRNKAVSSLKQLREYRDLRGSVAERENDARRAAFEKAKALAGSSDVQQRLAAACAFGALGDVTAIPPLLDLAQDRDASVRATAVKALEKLNAAPVAPPSSTPPKSKSE